MSMRILARVAAAALAAGTLAVLGLSAPTAQAAPQTTGTSQTYVAMGDSYSAGSGILPLDPAASLLCVRSTANYPHVLAARTGMALTDVTCGGAQTKDYAGSQYPGVAPQSDALGANTGLVTMTIGGNDNSTFIDAILACGSAGVATLGFGHPCQSLYGSTFTDQVDTGTYQAVKSALAAVRAKAPNARVAILGYPWIVPAAAVPGCFARLPIASGDVPYLRDLQTHLNAAVKRAAAETGATYVDVSGVSDGHDACQPAGTRWIEPILFGTNFVPVHPNALGESRLADRTAAVLGLG
ncbi:SGNH/GDSL hydrolase family protein [Actinacidiphila bryophytorum]|uniref:Lipase 2 n=1 Tax=Actinacidiphila bryophytorum TaxID=1436133 RepID=A0A9W4GZL7_9ACTN|nr:SGNH/GDSL hydrolase family protein [Actinacidiphila bryophytorum]MBM9438811.1 SGNH/GDSL hydrolase family protein [Actinacidiphila bryophytorum]MBN6548005.1 SGNH/GDSL hydrolase family protein [Actinacidiphila bryophytorum]CAG7614907.1 Lipase 2 [Actinacidiphila bryophytorum]